MLRGKLFVTTRAVIWRPWNYAVLDRAVDGKKRLDFWEFARTIDKEGIKQRFGNLRRSRNRKLCLRSELLCKPEFGGDHKCYVWRYGDVGSLRDGPLS